MDGEKFPERSVDLSLVAEWLRWLAGPKGRSARTVDMYRRIMAGLLQYHDKPLFSLTPRDIEKWVQEPRGGRAQGNVAKAATQARDVSCVRSFFRWAIASGHMTKDPTPLVATPPIKNEVPNPIPDEQWQRVWDAVWESDDSARRDAELIVLGLGFFGGLRREEITRLQVRHLDLCQRSLVSFVRKGGGTDVLPFGTMLEIHERRQPQLHAERVWPVLRKVAEARGGDEFLVGWADLGQPRARRSGELADGQLHPQVVNAWLARLSRRAQVGHLSPHRMRHSCATNLLRSGVPIALVKDLLNHASIATTMRYVKTSGYLAEWVAALGE